MKIKNSLQDLFPFIPFHKMKYLTPIRKESIFFETITNQIPQQWLEKPTLLTFNHFVEWEKMIESEKLLQLIQDPNLAGLIICHPYPLPIQSEIYQLFQQCGIPIIQCFDSSLLSILNPTKELNYTFSQYSNELHGFMEKGFTSIATELAKAFQVSILFLDDQFRVLWQTGNVEELEKTHQWVLSFGRKIIDEGTLSIKNHSDEPYEIYPIYDGDQIKQLLVTVSDLAPWQRKVLDKFVGLTTIQGQTMEIIQGLQEEFRDHFVYDLLYHKFESKTIMVKQGKVWGWNLEKPHHLFIINHYLANNIMEDEYWIERIIQTLEESGENQQNPFIVFPFQDQIIILIEDGETRTNKERKQFILEIAETLLSDLQSKWNHIEFKIGIGKWNQDTIQLNKGYQEAKLALQFGQKWFENERIFHIRDLGILSLLIGIHQELLLDFSREYLAPLIEGDAEHGTEYLTTLKAYIQYQGRINEVSESLHVHPNTLRNRVKKIEEIIGVNLQDHEELMNINIAVKIASLLDY